VTAFFLVIVAVMAATYLALAELGTAYFYRHRTPGAAGVQHAQKGAPHAT
jgi:hypothetical protein